MTAKEKLNQIATQVSICQSCILHFSRKKAVPGEGPFDSKVMFIGEGPGFHENQQGRPFVGAAGNFLEELLLNANLSRESVFITNVVKCRPPGNRDPLPDELLACGIFLDEQIEAINPLVIVTLGRFSMAKFFGNVKISQIHGQAKPVNNRLIVAMYHPAAALHQPSLKNLIIQDFKKLPGYINQANPIINSLKENEEEATEIKKDNPDQPKQLTLF